MSELLMNSKKDTKFNERTIVLKQTKADKIKILHDLKYMQIFNEQINLWVKYNIFEYFISEFIIALNQNS